MGAIQNSINQVLGTAAVATKLINDAGGKELASASAELNESQRIEAKNQEIALKESADKVEDARINKENMEAIQESYTGDKRLKVYRTIKKDVENANKSFEMASRADKDLQDKIAFRKAQVEAINARFDIEKTGANTILGKHQLAKRI